MNSNDLRDPIEIWKYNVSDNSGGTPIEQYLFYRKKYALVKFLGGGTDTTNLGKSPYSNATIWIRYDAMVDYHCQIKYEEVFYEIQHIEILGREDWMKIQAIVYNQIF